MAVNAQKGAFIKFQNVSVLTITERNKVLKEKRLT